GQARVRARSRQRPPRGRHRAARGGRRRRAAALRRRQGSRRADRWLRDTRGGPGCGRRPTRRLHCRANEERQQNVISPRIDSLLENVDSNYASVVVAAKRARQINSYYHNLGEGSFDECPPPMVETASKNYLT